ncbi:phage tail protein [Pectobacterium brasiliense]|uniref:Tail fiber protein n=8 Tax=Pectobacteriaceae TaxID=1903410 RepID=A0ABS2X7X1_9GAMM|nr:MULTISPECIES: phage tail protein [Pectobacterium]MBN3087760.1 tail fiber protein [Pectobacterium brasiliense]MBN3108844.1 tail fiber protein [Pectobacterium brasiliense]MBN3113255.1 tail fiber protein [Pectobacterium brasiliense]MBN3205760.1 tail fiber protein [Pectobacterium brasiliense]MCA5928656.1 phage tail protein [Pectobacterium brasiliense]
MWGTPVPPEGWLELNGQLFNPSGNPVLADLYPSSRVPDFRGYFPRGWDNGAGIDPDSSRSVLSYQDDEIISHKHAITMSHEHHGAADGAGFPQTDGSGPMIKHAETEPDGSFPERSGAGNPMFSFGGPETRPKNIAVMFIIKAG